MQCIHHCVFLFVLFLFLVCVAAAWLLQARARQINTQHSQAYALNTCWLKKKKRRERGNIVGVCMVVVGGADFYLFFCLFVCFLQLQRALCAGGVGRG